jgi:hypothetical protein
MWKFPSLIWSILATYPQVLVPTVLIIISVAMFYTFLVPGWDTRGNMSKLRCKWIMRKRLC